jgi:(1->4)-alpha-D-glucan 1-alpha-D-glucosylmutase
VQTLLRMTVPGIPDLYQGAEFWDLSLVDPDNRRPVDYAAREQALQATLSPAQLLTDWHNGHIKQQLIARTLRRRAEQVALFARGTYQPLPVLGEQADRVLAFARIHADDLAIVIVPRLASELLGDAPSPLIEAQKWGDTRVVLPSKLTLPTLKGLFSDVAVTPNKELWLNAALKDFPVNLLVQSDL